MMPARRSLPPPPPPLQPRGRASASERAEGRTDGRGTDGGACFPLRRLDTRCAADAAAAFFNIATVRVANSSPRRVEHTGIYAHVK